MGVKKIINKYFLLEEEISTNFGSNFRCAELRESNEFNKHINLFVLNPEISRRIKIKSILNPIDYFREIISPKFIRLEKVEKINNSWFFVKEFMPGIRLSQIIYEENSPRMNLNINLFIFKEIYGALKLIHSDESSGSCNHGLIHPFNILVTEKGEIKFDNYFFGRILSNLFLKREEFQEYYAQILPYDESNIIQFNPQTDIIQMGMLFLEMLIGKRAERNLSTSEIEELIESSKTINIFNEEEPIEEEVKDLLKKTLQISSEGNFSDLDKLFLFLELNILNTGKYLPIAKSLSMFLSAQFVSKFQILKETLKNEESKNYTSEIERIDEDLKITIKIIEDLISKDNYDEALSVIEESLVRFPGNRQILSIKEKTEEARKKKIEEVLKKKSILTFTYWKKTGIVEEVLRDIQEGRFDEAKKTLNRILEADLENKEVKNLLELIDISPEEIPNLFYQYRFDDALLAIEIILAKFPDNLEILTIKEQIESAISQRIEEVKSAFENKEYREVLSKIYEFILQNPKSFESLNQYKKSIEEYIENKFSEAKEAYEKGEREVALSVLSYIKEINADNRVKPHINEIQELIDKIEGVEIEKLKKPEEAKKKQKEQINSDLDRAEILIINADGFRKKLQLDQALEIVNIILLIDSQNTRALNLKEKIREKTEERKGGLIKWIVTHKFAAVLSVAIPVIFAVILLLLIRPQTSILLIQQRGIDYTGVTGTVDNTPISILERKRKKIKPGTHEIIFKKGDHFYTKKISVNKGKTKKIEIPLYKLEVNIIPRGNILEDERELTRESRRVQELFLLPNNIYNIMIRENRYNSEERIITVIVGTILSDGERLEPSRDDKYKFKLNINLDEVRYGILRINVFPSGQVYEGSTLLATCPPQREISLSEGTHRLRFTTDQPGCEPIERDYQITAGSTRIINEYLCFGVLNVLVMPSGYIYEGNRQLARCPPRQPIRLHIGEHTLRFRSDEQGCYEIERPFTFSTGQEETVVIHLCFGYLDVSTFPPGAEIIIDGRPNDLEGNPYGRAPRTGIRLPTGQHMITFRHPDYPPRTEEFVIFTNSKTRV